MKFNQSTVLTVVLMMLLPPPPPDVECFFSNPLKKLKQKAKDIYRRKFGKDRTWHFLGHDLSEYPGTDARYRKINQDKWGDYYRCLKEQNSNLGEHLSVTPEALQAFEGGSVKFECKVCISPQEGSRTDAVEWEWSPAEGKTLEPVDYTEHVLLSPEDKTLHIYNLQYEQSGQYVCKLGESLTAPYFLTVVNSSDNALTEVHPTKAPKGPHPRPAEVLLEHNIVLDTEWSQWSECSSCDKVGRRHRLGYCTVGVYDLSVKPIKPKGSKISRDDFELLTIFKYGLPCKSHILPDSVRSLQAVKNRTDEIMVGYCKAKCPEEQVFVIKDKNGRVLETANNSAGIYSMLQGPPPVEPAVERRLVYGAKNTDLTVSCPGSLNSDTPIQWQIGSKNVVPELLSKESRGRVYVSVSDKIHIKKAKLSDSNIYSCWQHKELAGTVRLIVEKRIIMNFNHHIMLFGIVLILSTFLYVFAKAYAGKRYALIKK